MKIDAKANRNPETKEILLSFTEKDCELVLEPEDYYTLFLEGVFHKRRRSNKSPQNIQKKKGKY